MRALREGASSSAFAMVPGERLISVPYRSRIGEGESVNKEIWGAEDVNPLLD